jgi:DNA invertase Pin-like site-specific DNA recombinase
MSNVIAYYRVSTDRQRRSGLGIEAQRSTVHRFVEAEGLTILSEYIEAETGKGADERIVGLSKLATREEEPEEESPRSVSI